MKTLFDDKEITPTDLEKKIGCGYNTYRGHIETLVEAKMMKRQKVMEDPRHMRYRITEKGEKVFLEFREIMLKLLDA